MKIGRNDPCPCGSGLKHKKCCAAKDDADRTAQLAAEAAAAPPVAPDSEPTEETGAKSQPGHLGDWKRQPRKDAGPSMRPSRARRRTV